MTTLMKWLNASLWFLALLGGQSLASEPSHYLEPINETRPAVDGVNGKLSFSKSIDGLDLHGVSGSLAAPVGHQFGLQIDGKVGEVDTDVVGDIPVYAAAAHAFWRNPARGMLGLYAGYSHIDVLGGVNFGALGVEGALYFDRFSIDLVVGGIDGDIANASFFDVTRLSYYPTDNLLLHVGHAYAYSTHGLNYGLEWSPGGHAGAAAALYARGSIDEHGSHSAGVGLRFYFGQHDKSLIRRHREDDPLSSPHAVLPCVAGLQIQDGSNYTIVFGQTGGLGCGGSPHPW